MSTTGYGVCAKTAVERRFVSITGDGAGAKSAADHRFASTTGYGVCAKSAGALRSASTAGEGRGARNAADLRTNGARRRRGRRTERRGALQSRVRTRASCFFLPFLFNLRSPSLPLFHSSTNPPSASLIPSLSLFPRPSFPSSVHYPPSSLPSPSVPRSLLSSPFLPPCLPLSFLPFSPIQSGLLSSLLPSLPSRQPTPASITSAVLAPSDTIRLEEESVGARVHWSSEAALWEAEECARAWAGSVHSGGCACAGVSEEPQGTPVVRLSSAVVCTGSKPSLLLLTKPHARDWTRAPTTLHIAARGRSRPQHPQALPPPHPRTARPPPAASRPPRGRAVVSIPSLN